MEDYARILDLYKRLRSASRELNNSLMDRGKLPVKQAAKELGVLVNDTIVLDIDQLPLVMDRAIYCCADDGRNAVDRFVAEHPPSPGSDAEAVLAAMQRAFFSIFVGRDIVEGVGLHVTDLLRSREHFLADVSLSKSAVEQFGLISRMLPFDGFIMTTGTPLPMDADALRRLAEGLEQAGLSHEKARSMPDQASAELEALVIGGCLVDEQGQEVTYQDVPERAGPPPIRNDSTRVGRNDPCPCGNGKKYKKCCGR